MTHPSSPGSALVGLLQGVLDDDDRTRRADVLLSHVTVWLVMLTTLGVVVGLVLLNASPWASAGAGGVGLLAGIVAWWRRRRRLAGGAAAGAERPASDVAVDESGAEAAPAS